MSYSTVVVVAERWQAVAYGMAMYAIGYAVAYQTRRRK
jgi:type IV secretory pathway TrbD component